MLGTAIRILLVAGLVLLSSATGSLRADEQPASPATPAAKPETTEPRDGNVLAEFEVAKDGDYLLLPVTIQGKTYSFVVDTGATHHVFDVTLRPLLGEPLQQGKVLTTGKSVNASFFTLPDCRIGSVPVRGRLPVMCLDLAWLSQGTGYNVSGVIGLDFLRTQIVDVDFDRGRLQLLRSTPANHGARISLLHRNVSLPFVVATIDGIGPVPLNVDTGSNAALDVDQRLYQRLAQAGIQKPRDPPFVSSAGKIENVAAGLLLANLSLQSYKHRNLHFSTSRYSALGLGYWSRYRTVFDFPHQALYLIPGKHFKAADHDDLSGIMLYRNESGTVVHKVHENSPALDAGIHVGDIVISIDGDDIAEHSLFEIYRTLSRHPRFVKIRVSRAGALTEKTLQLRDYRSRDNAPAAFPSETPPAD